VKGAVLANLFNTSRYDNGAVQALMMLDYIVVNAIEISNKSTQVRPLTIELPLV
jgi:hypothetical protein